LQQNPDGMNVEYPDAHVAAVQSAVPEPLHSVHASTDVSIAKLLQQNPPVMNVENPAAHVACKHSVTPPPVQSTQDPWTTDISPAKSLQQIGVEVPRFPNSQVG
jgi:hypothetical protein